MGEGSMSYIEISHKHAESKEALGELKVKYIASLAKTKQLSKQFYELGENNSSKEANIDGLSNEIHVELATPVIDKKARKEVEEFYIAQDYSKEMIDEARTRFEEKKAGTSSAPTSRQTRSENVKKENSPPPPKIQIRIKAKKDEPQAPKATRKRKKEQAQKSVQAKTEEVLKKKLGLEQEELEKIDSSKEEELSEALENEQFDVVHITEPLKKDEETQKDTQESVQIDVEKTKKSPKKEEDKQKEEAHEKKVTYQSLNSNKIIDDIMEIQGPINMDILISTELMEIASTMQSKAKKKIMRTQMREAQTINNVVDIFSSMLLETDTNSLTTPIEKLDHLVTSTREQMKSLGEAALHNIEKEYEKKRNETLIKEIDKDKEGLTVNMDQIK
ncbi:stress response protein NST1-like [Cryptomeria japonica]|uniref:stress response protein NST1-like n=1 Tax=Cryptomeria japonica TaxID=3369 RepID=UPI0027DA5EA4|nr:stress response protein NST1-like [Cryptomeria japonica]